MIFQNIESKMSATTRKSSVADTSVNKNDISSSSKSNGMTLDRRDSESDEGKDNKTKK